ncbi:MAG: hypothetical protein KDA60_21965, partial [Planctomycetales bacterium]|nr:hypothetical protein [Planctomycetales bacterium]
MNESVGTALQPAYDVVRTLRRRWKRVVAVGTFVLALAIVALVVWPRTYVSEGEVFVQMGHESVALDPTATTGTTVPIFENRENEINSALEMLQSREVLTRVVKRLSATVILNGIMTEEGVGVGGPEDGNGLVAYCQETVEGAADSVKRWMDRGEPISEDELAVV